MQSQTPDASASPRESAPAISVVMTACADSPGLRRCLATVRAQADALGAELLLAINADAGAIDAAVREAWAPLCHRIVYEPRVGKSHALATAIAAARGEVIAFTDDDTEPQPGWLEAITAPLVAADRPPGLAGCGGPVTPRFDGGEPPAWLARVISANPTHFLGPRHELGDAPLDYRFEEDAGTWVPLGANCAYRREVFEKYRYDERLGPNRDTGLRGGEDTVLGKQLLRDGHRIVYCPAARMVHPVAVARTTYEFARRAHVIHGIEHVRERHILGLPMASAAEVRRRMRKLHWRRRWLRLSRGANDLETIRIDLKIATREGMLRELDAIERATD